MKPVKIKITFKEILLAQDMGFATHREFVALKFKEAGFIVVDFMALRYRTYQDGHKSEYNIYTLVEGDIGKALMKA
jgi:hypothetical protein